MSELPHNGVQIALADTTVKLSGIDWKPDVSGIRVRELQVEGRRWALVGYAPGGRRDEWCHDGHFGVVLSGQIEYEFEDGGQPVSATEGDAFTLTTGRGHRGKNRGDTATTLLVIDDPFA